MSQEHEGLFYTSPKMRGNCRTFCRDTEEGLLEKENFCDDALEISLKNISEYSSSPPRYATDKKIITEKKINKILELLCYY